MQGIQSLGHALVTVVVSVVVVGCGSLQAASLDDTLKAVQATNNEAAASQKRIADLQSQTQAMAEEYKRLTQGADYQQSVSAETQLRVEEQVRELASLREQLASRQITQQRIMPLMRSMAETLEQFVVLDVPFHQEERVERVMRLKQQLASSSISLPEKFRALLSAYQQELELGRSLEAWRGELPWGGEKLTVEYLRVGRVAFYFQTMDGLRSGYWDKTAKQWIELPRDYATDIKQGMRIAHNHQAPHMLALPMKH